jgi:F-type H+-transporting ATPase subunit delta
MANHGKIAQLFARKLFGLSLADGTVSAERVGGVLAYVEKHHPANPVMVLKAYHRLIAAELAKGEAVVEHAGPVNDAMLAAIASAMSKKYSRTVTARSKPSPALLAGIRVHVGDDIYESSVASQLDTLASSV